MDLEQARRRVVDEVERTAAAIAPDAEAEEVENPGDSPCFDALGAPSEEVKATHEVEISIEGLAVDEVIEAVRSQWESAGLEVAPTQNGEKDFPAVYAGGEGFRYSISVARERNLARIGGSSPCLPPPES